MSAYNLFVDGYSLEHILHRRADDLSSYTLNRKNFYYELYDPVSQLRLKPDSYGFQGSGLYINKHGFVSNRAKDAQDPVLDIFPEKPDNFYRIVVLGGSSMEGVGLDHSNQTIPANLERLLNENKPDKNKVYQVLNFGIGGFFTGTELVKFLTELVYYEPDAVISLDGFNEVVFMQIQPMGFVDTPIINWAKYSYYHFEAMNGYKESVPPKFMRLTFTFIQKFLNKLKPAKSELYKNLPLYDFSKKLKKESPFLKEVVYNNLNSLAAYSAMNDISALLYLQPYAAQGKPWSDTEKEIFKKRATKEGDPSYNYSSPEVYEEKMRGAYERYKEVYKDLGAKYSDYNNVKFLSAVNMFENNSETIYVDEVHYNENGTKIIAKKFYDDLFPLIKKQ